MACVSVIVPVYKVEPYLRRCVDSILAQTFADFELILVDDGSPDNCGAICDEYAEIDARIHVIHQENGGLSAARNAGIDWAFAHSDSEWLSFVDSDDWVHPKYLELLYDAACTQCVKVSVCGYQEVEAEIEWKTANSAQATCWPVERYYVECCVNATVAWGKLYYKECFEKLRYPVGKIHEDEYVTYRILFAYEQIAVVDMPMYAYFVNPQGIMRQKWNKKQLDKCRAIEEQICFFEKHKHSIAVKQRAQYFWYYLYIEQHERVKKEELLHKNKHLTRIIWIMRRVLFQYHRFFRFLPENYWKYEIAFPRLMRIFWYTIVVKNKIKGLLKKDVED